MGPISAQWCTRSSGGISQLRGTGLAERRRSQHLGVFHDSRTLLCAILRFLSGPSGLSWSGPSFSPIPRRARNPTSLAHSAGFGWPQGAITSSGISKSMRTSQHGSIGRLNSGVCFVSHPNVHQSGPTFLPIGLFVFRKLKGQVYPDHIVISVIIMLSDMSSGRRTMNPPTTKLSIWRRIRVDSGQRA